MEKVSIGTVIVEERGVLQPGYGVLRRNWKWAVLRGALALVLGIVAFLFPMSALFAFTMAFAAYAAVDGILSLVSAVRGAAHKQDRWWVYVARGLVGIGIVALFVITPLSMTIGYALTTLVMLSVWAIAAGALELAAAVRLRKAIDGEWLMGLPASYPCFWALGSLFCS